MIPLAIPAAIKAVPWRIVGLALAAAALIALGWRITAWREAYKAYPKAQAALANEEACGKGSKCAERIAALQARQAVVSATVVQGYQDEIEALRNRPIPTRTVRLRCTASAGDVRGTDATGTADGTGSPGGIVPEPAERNIDVAALYGLAQEADEVAARLRGLQGWNRALAVGPTGK